MKGQKNRSEVSSSCTPKLKKSDRSVSTTLEEDFDEENGNAICLWQDIDMKDPVRKIQMNNALSIEIDSLENETLALDLIDINNSQNNESIDSITPQLQFHDNDRKTCSVPDIRYARNFDPVAFTLMNDGIEDREALLKHDRIVPYAPNSPDHMHNFGEKSSDFIPIMSDSLSDIMDDEEVTLLARPVAIYPHHNNLLKYL